MLFGTIVGSLADKQGRKRACVTYCITYILSCITKHSTQYRVLIVGRVLGGIATSLLFSSFESWLVAEHNKRNFDQQWLSLTFSKAVFLGNGHCYNSVFSIKYLQIFASDSFLELTEYSREEILGRNCRFLQGPETDPATVKKIRNAIDNQTDVTVQLINYTKSGKKFWNVFHLQPMRDQTVKKATL